MRSETAVIRSLTDIDTQCKMLIVSKVESDKHQALEQDRSNDDRNVVTFPEESDLTNYHRIRLRII